MGWYILYLAVCSVNVILIRCFTDLTLADAAMWLWMLLPAIAFGCAGEIYRKG